MTQVRAAAGAVQGALGTLWEGGGGAWRGSAPGVEPGRVLKRDGGWGLRKVFKYNHLSLQDFSLTQLIPPRETK